MNGFKNYFWMAAAFAVLAMVVGVFSAGPAIAQAVRAALVSNVDDPGRIPYRIELRPLINHQDCTAQLTDFAGYQIDAPPVPAGKRLVITNVSGRIATNLPGGTLIVPFVAGLFSDVAVYAPITYGGSFQGLNYFAFSQQT